MTKYRIVKRNKSPYTFDVECYYAQVKQFDLFWVDCKTINFFSPDEWTESWDWDVRNVESYIERKLKSKEPVKNEVVKVYYEENT